ncbi:MAG: hypothetical protein N2508_11530 [Anaerolineae bacterium]|nr:hypothetical protein [Anaerolineae bacterium]
MSTGRINSSSLMGLALAMLIGSLLACNAPTPTPPYLFLTITPAPTVLTSSPLPPPTETATPTQPAATATPTPTETITPTPTPTPTPTRPVSTGPLDFPAPTALDHWRPWPGGEPGEMEATIILRITGGAPPYTVYHDLERVTTTWENTPKIVFKARGCDAMVHTITVTSADGQSVARKYWIPAPWCE